MSDTKGAQGQKLLDETRFLFSKETMEQVTEAERRGEYTLERVLERYPEKVREVIHLRGQGYGQQRIAKLCNLHHRTIARIDQAYPAQIEEERRRRVAKLRSAADKLVELVDDNPESVPANVRCLAASQLIDKAELLSGGPTARIECGGPPLNIQAMWERMGAEADRILGEAVGNGRKLTPVESARLDAMLEAVGCALYGNVPKLIDMVPVNGALEASQTDNNGKKMASIIEVES
jgi:hypothetical protein